jgi:hypothetical protein
MGTSHKFHGGEQVSVAPTPFFRGAPRRSSLDSSSFSAGECW